MGPRVGNSAAAARLSQRFRHADAAENETAARHAVEQVAPAAQLPTNSALVGRAAGGDGIRAVQGLWRQGGVSKPTGLDRWAPVCGVGLTSWVRFWMQGYRIRWTAIHLGRIRWRGPQVQYMLGAQLKEFIVSEQKNKYHLSLAGEFLVAGELQRRHVSAAVTYGNAKAADVVAFSPSGDRAIVIEVKTTSQAKWIVGGAVPPKSNQPWVFVNLPIDETQSPEFYIMPQSELNRILTPGDTAYRVQYKAKHGNEFVGKAVVGLSRELALPFKGAWGNILSAIGA